MKQNLLKKSVIAITFSLLLNPFTRINSQEKNYSDIVINTPFIIENISSASFQSYSVNIKDFGAVADGKTLNTTPINNAIKNVHEKGGGKVIIPSGLWLTGPIEILSNVNLYTEKNALILFTDDHNQYPIINTSFEGLVTKRCQSPIYSRNATNIAITGNGIFDGNGDTWRPVKKDKLTPSQWNNIKNKGGVVDKDDRIWYPSESSFKGSKLTTDFNVPKEINSEEEWNSIRDWLRPVLLSFSNCSKVLLQGVTFKNSPSWCLHPLLCEDLIIDNINVSNPWYSQNGDGLDLESCNRVLVQNSLFDAGDDAICINSGKDEQGRKRGEPCQNIIVRDNFVLHGHGGFVVGSEMSGGVKNIYVSNCTFLGTDVGLRFKSTRGRGGVVENIFIDNINMVNIPNDAILFDLFYGGKSREEEISEGKTLYSEEKYPVTEETPSFKNIHIQNITCNGVGSAALFNGLPEMRIENVNLENINIINANNGFIINNVNNIKIDNVNIQTVTGRNRFELKNISNIEINDELYKTIDNKAIIIN